MWFPLEPIVVMLIFAAQQALPLVMRLGDVGRDLEAAGPLVVDAGESYATKALDHLLQASAA